MSPPAHLENYLDSPLDALKAQYIGTHLATLPTPAIILDRSKIVRNCNAMLQVCRKLGVGFRAHVKSHKVSPFPYAHWRCVLNASQTLELSKLQVGGVEGEGRVDFVVSTLVEAERLGEWVGECQGRGRSGSVRHIISFIHPL
jgi:hypothetical protein